VKCARCDYYLVWCLVFQLLVVLLFVWQSLRRRASLAEIIPSPRYIYYPRIFHIHGHRSSVWLHVPHTPDVPLHYILWCDISFYAKHTIPAWYTFVDIHINSDMYYVAWFIIIINIFNITLSLLLLRYNLYVSLWLNIGIVTARYTTS